MNRLQKFFIIAAGIILVCGIGFGIYTIYTLQTQVKKMKVSSQTSQEAQKEEAKALVAKVGALISVPSDEQPTIATVTDPEKLKSQAFFAAAKIGDKVLIFTVAKKAILYRPSENKIIEVSPVTIGGASATGSATLKESVRFALYNGTSTVGLTKRIEPILKSKIADATVVIKENAKKNDYTKTILVDVTGKNSVRAAEFAKVLGYTVESLPPGEIAPKDGEFLIILGTDSIQ